MDIYLHLQRASQAVLVVKNLPANAGDVRDWGSIPGSGRPPGGGHGNPLQYSCLENPTDRGAWRATVHRVTESDTTEATGHTCTNTACYFWDFGNPWVEVEFWCFICILLVTVKGKNSFTDFYPAHFFFHESTSHGFCLFCHWILFFFPYWIVFAFYWVDQKVHSSLSTPSYKPWMNFLSNTKYIMAINHL